MNLKTYNRLKQEVENLRSEADKSSGALDQAMIDLRKQGCNTTKEAEELLAKQEKELKRLQTEFDSETTKFEKQWNDTLTNNS